MKVSESKKIDVYVCKSCIDKGLDKESFIK